MDYFADIADERRGFADLLDTLDSQQLATPSLCAGWTVHDIAAHLVVPLATGIGTVILQVVRARGDFNRVNLVMTRSMARRPAAELASLLRAHADNHFAPPGVGSIAPLMDMIVHGQDARRPLGIDRDIPPGRLVAVLEFLASPTAAKGFSKGRASALRLEATDIGWTHGDGPLVAGTGEALIMSLAGRRVALADLSGDGVATLAARS